MVQGGNIQYPGLLFNITQLSTQEGHIALSTGNWCRASIMSVEDKDITPVAYMAVETKQGEGIWMFDRTIPPSLSWLGL